MTKSYKMVVLQYMLEKVASAWHKHVTPLEVAPYFHQFYMKKEHRKQINFSSANTKRLWEYNEIGVTQLIERMTMNKWMDKNNDLVLFEEGKFFINFSID